MHESSPLLPTSFGDVISKRASIKTYKSETRSLVELAGPVMLTFGLEFLPGIVCIILVGQLNVEGNDILLDAAALAVMFLNLTAMSIGFGLATAMDTYASQAVGKAEGLDASICNSWLRTYLLTGIFVLSLAFIPVFWVNFFSSSILIALQQPKEIAVLCEKFVILMLPGVPFLYLYELMKKVLQAKHVIYPMVISAILANLVNVIVGYYLVYHTSLGWLGAAVSRTCCNMCFPLFLLPYFYRLGLIENSLASWNISLAVKGMKDFFILGLSGMFQLCFEWWAFEVLALLSGVLPNAVQAIGANAVILNISAMTYMFFLGISVAGSVRIGNAIGSRSAKRARIACDLTIIFAVVIGALTAVLLIIFRTSLPKLFTKDEPIQNLTNQLMVVAAFYQISDAINASIQGALRGTGRQALGAKLNFVCYYIIGLPLGAIIAIYFEVGVVGLWMGITLGLTLISVVGLIIICRTDWEHLITTSNSLLAGVTDSYHGSNHEYGCIDSPENNIK